MFAGVQTCSSAAACATLAAAAAGCSGLAALYTLDGAAGGCLVTLWRPRDAAETASGVHAGALYEVIADGADPSGRAPSAAVVLWFSGPLPAGRLAVLRQVYGDRIPPAVAGVPGMVRGIVGWQAGSGATVEVLLATSREALDAAGAAVNAPLPGDSTPPHSPDTLEPYTVVARPA